jgi:hypothetical protein
MSDKREPLAASLGVYGSRQVSFYLFSASFF